MAQPIRWAIVGTGSIARQFARALAVLPDAKLSAVASRSRPSADRFGDEFGVPHRHVGAAEAAANADVDVVYIGTPHTLHAVETLACLDAGKAVLCEKPFAMNAAQARAMVARARRKRLFLMEAMWTHFFPAMHALQDQLAAGAVGPVRLVQSSFGFRHEGPPDGRLLDPALGGGALLDVGVYNVALAHRIFGGPPVRVGGMARLGPTGVDEDSVVDLGFPGGALAHSSCSVRTETVHEAYVFGETGHVRIPHSFWQPDGFVLVKDGTTTETRFERIGNGYTYEAIEVMRCLREGALESPVVPLTMSVEVMETMDELRRQWGLVYPADSDERFPAGA